MQHRQTDRRLYFNELAATSDKYFFPYISAFIRPGEGTGVLEIGCGEGGNLLPFAKAGCSVTGVDLAENKIADAIRFFEEENAPGRFIASDIFKITGFEKSFDLIICHDVIEHIFDKKAFMANLEKEGCITELLEIKQTRTPIELFEKLLHEYNAELLDRKLWFINPHYEVKFGLKPRKLPAFLGKIPWLRNFFTTSCFYVFRFR